MKLARHYPKAKQALIEIRDRGTREFSQGGGYFDLFMEVSRINEQLGEQDTTYALFKSIQARDPKLGRQCYLVIEDLLVEKGEYSLCASFIPNFQERFESVRAVRERRSEIADRTPQADQALHRKQAELAFIKETRKLIEILVGVGRKAEAETIRDQAVSILNVTELQSAVADAETKIGKPSRSPEYMRLAAQVESLRARVQQLNQQYTSEHPLVKRSLEQLRDAEKKLKALQEETQ
jgi:hypothetical protein